MSSREPTLADVAELAGVSLTTVSRVLNNRGYLSEKTKKNVADAIEKLGYRPNSLARALHGKRTQTVGLIVPAVSLPFFGELAVEVENALADAGYRILICNSMGRADREREYLSLLVGNRVDGIISGAHNEGLGEYDTIRMPLGTIDRELSPSIPNVRCANEEAGAMATRALIEGGCRHPLLLTSRSGPRNLREAGYRTEVERAGLTPHVVTVPFDTPTPQRFAMVRDALADDASTWGQDAASCPLEPFVLLLRPRGAELGIYRVRLDGVDLVRPLPQAEEIEGMAVQKEFARAGAIVSVAANLDEADAWGGAAGYRFTMSRSAALIYSLHLRAAARGLVGTVFAVFATSAVRHLLDSDGVSRHQMFAVTIARPQTEPPAPAAG